MFRQATLSDLEQIAAIYDHIHTEEEAGRATVGWVRGVYPTRQTALDAIQAGDMFVAEENGRLVATAKINQEQVPEYAEAAWTQDAPPEQVMVLHTLVVDPQAKGRGYGSRFVDFYESYALEHGCRYLRMDTNERNASARALYRNLGYQAKEWAKKEAITIRTADADALTKYFEANAKSLLDGGVKIEKVSGHDASFTIAPADGSYKVSFGEDEFVSFFKEFLRPGLVEMLF